MNKFLRFWWPFLFGLNLFALPYDCVQAATAHTVHDMVWDAAFAALAAFMLWYSFMKTWGLSASYFLTGRVILWAMHESRKANDKHEFYHLAGAFQVSDSGRCKPADGYCVLLDLAPTPVKGDGASP